MVNLKSLISPNIRVKFDYFRDGCLWYSTQNGFQFPVNVNGLSKMTTLLPNGKATDFEYWIKKEYFLKKSLDNHQ